MTSLERVARALCQAHFDRKQHYGTAGKEERVQYLVEKYWRNHAGDARAAVKALWEPDVDVQVAGTEAWLCESAMEDRALANWQAMIDAILAEES